MLQPVIDTISILPLGTPGVRAVGAHRAIVVDKVASVAGRALAAEPAFATGRASDGQRVTVSLSTFAPRVGDLVAVRLMNVNPSYDRIELANGRMATLSPGDVIVGALGARRALKGFVGDVPAEVAVGDHLNILNLGGVIGRCTGHHQELGAPMAAEVLGAVVEGGQIVNLAASALPYLSPSVPVPPVIAVAGSCMHAGKTRAATELVRRFHANGAKVAAAKLSGVACLKDTLTMQDHGAYETLSFLDFGLPSTVGTPDLGPLTRSIIAHLAQGKPDVIVAELGDGILGGYNVASILDDELVRRSLAALVFCANDFVSAWGGVELLRRQGLAPDVISGPATDSRMGVDFIRQTLGVPAANAVTGAASLHAVVLGKVEAWKERGESWPQS